MRAGRPSETAVLVAASVLREGAAHGLPPAALQMADEGLRVAAASGSLVAALARHRAGRWALAAAERCVLPGLAAHHCRRKAWLWQRLKSHTPPGTQLLWLGAGFDGLGRALLGTGADVRLVETDHPDTLRLRASAGDDSGGAAELLPLALPRDLPELLAVCARQSTTVVCEGMLMYLARRDVALLLRALARLPAPPRLLFTALDTLRPGGFGFRRRAGLVRGWLEHHGEPFCWRMPPARLARHLLAAGYRVDAQWDGEDFGEYAIDASPALVRPARRTG